jgi:hypothetical protein
VKSAFLVARTDTFLTLAIAEAEESARRNTGLTVDPDVDSVRITKEGVGTMLIESLDGVAEWEWGDPIRDAGMAGPMHGFLVTCRSERFFCCVVRALAVRIGVELWVVDSEGTVFEADAVRPDLVRL